MARFAVTPLIGGLLLSACHVSDAGLGKTGEPVGEVPSGTAGEVPEEMASVSMALVNVPNDALCLELSVFPTTGTWGGRTQLFDTTPGSSPILTLNGLPSGNASLGARSFGVPCSQVTSGTSPTWVTAGPVPVTLVAGQPVSTSVVLLRPGYVQVTATFNDGTPTITPSTKDFGAVQVGGTASATFSVTNPGTAALALTAPTFTGTDASQFQMLQNACGTSLAAGSTCTVSISFKPTAAGNKTATLSLGSVNASLSGSAFASILTISPSPANFPSTQVGNSASLTLTLTNGSVAAVSLGSWSITGGTEFGYGATTCGTSLAAAASCTQVINFAPTSAGSKTATLSSSAGASVTLNGTATAPSVAYHINCGSSTVVSPFTADQYFSGGTQASYNSKTITVSGVANAAPAAVYQSERYGNATYTFPGLTASASYTVRLHFAELYWTATGKRLFNVAINGAAVLSRLDLYATVGSLKAYVRDFTATANSSGQIVVALTTVTDNATISGIEILSSTSSYPEGPCDIYRAAGTPCAAAHATVRTLYSAYPGPLYQVQRASDNQTKDIMVNAKGFADMTAQDTFCQNTTCTIPIIYDQSGNGNHLRVTWWAYWLRNGAKPANAKGQVIKVGGNSVTGIMQTAYSLDVGYRTGVQLPGKASVSKGSTTVTFTSPQTLPANTPLFFAANTADCPPDSWPNNCKFKPFWTAAGITNATTVTLKSAYDGTTSSSTDVWNHATKGMPVDDESEAMYSVLDAKRYSEYCCFAYGNAALSGVAEGNATMEAAHFGSVTQFGQSGGGSGPWVGADLENGIFEGYENGSAKVLSNTSITGMDYVTAMVKGPSANDCPASMTSSGCFGLKAGDSQLGKLEWKFSAPDKAYGPRPPTYSPQKKQGAIILATGGDGSNGGTGTWFEGAIVKGLPSDATDDAVQANIVAAGYGK